MKKCTETLKMAGLGFGVVKGKTNKKNLLRRDWGAGGWGMGSG